MRAVYSRYLELSSLFFVRDISNIMIDKKTYWIVFKNAGDNPPLWSFFMKSGFEHCLILTQDEFNWYICDPTRRQLTFEILYYSPIYNFPHQLRTKTKTKIIQITMSPPKKNFIMRKLFLYNCVTIVKYFIGLNLCVFTPWQLYKKLRKLHTDLEGRTKAGIESIEFLF